MISIITLFACMDVDKPADDTGEDTGSNVTDAPEFVGMDFLLESSEGYQPVSERISLGFPSINGDEIEFQFDASCNSMGGTFTFEDGIVNMDGVWMTEMGCDQELMEEDDWFVEFWTSGVSMGLEDDLLRVSDGTNTFYFRDSEVVTPDLPLVGNLWVVDTFIEGEAASNIALDTDPSFEFFEDGYVSVDSGCNGGGGDYTVNGSTISMDMVAWTEMECMDEGLQFAESHLQQVFTGDIEFEIDASRIYLINGSIGVSATAQ